MSTGNNQPLISIDWDHTFRNTHGLDLNLLALVCYANAKNIPIGLTTHRDIENTTLYTLYHWQYEKPNHDSVALAAAINYWLNNILRPLNIKLNFINARYQPNYHQKNYYNEVLLPHEQILAHEIKLNNLLDDRDNVKRMILKYQKVNEGEINHNEYKGAQIAWLSEYFKNKFSGRIYHIDDNSDVCDLLVDDLENIKSDNIDVNTIYYHDAPLFANKSCAALLKDIGLIDDWERFITNNYLPFCDNYSLYLSLCFFATQVCYSENNILEQVSTNLHKNTFFNNNLSSFIKKIINKTLQTGQPVCFFLNEGWTSFDAPTYIKSYG